MEESTRRVIELEKATFELKQNAIGRVYFVFKNPRDNRIVVSQSFSDRSALETCITSIRNSVKIAIITEEGQEEDAPPSFRIYQNSSLFYNFCMRGMEGEILMNSEGYKEKSECLKSLESFKSFAHDAKILDLI